MVGVPQLPDNDSLPSAEDSITPRYPGLVNMALKTKAQVYAHYVPLFERGGVFLPTPRDYKIGDGVIIMVTLPDDESRYPVAGRVAMVLPKDGPRQQGVAIHLRKGIHESKLVQSIQELLGAAATTFVAAPTLWG